MIFLLTFSYLNVMPPTPLVEWEEQEIADGAVSFSDRINQILNATILSTTPPAMLTTPPSSTPPPTVLRKIKQSVEHVVPQIVDIIHHELTGPAISRTESTPSGGADSINASPPLGGADSINASPPCPIPPIQVCFNPLVLISKMEIKYLKGLEQFLLKFL
jgi:hypothetical protein